MTDLRTNPFAGPSWPMLATLACVLMLASAHAFEIFGKMAPCALCLRQRDVYWAAMAMSVVGLVLWQRKPANRYLVALNVMLGLVFVTGAVVATYHAGVEWGVWAGPAGCSGDLASGLEDINLLESLNQRIATVSCSEAPWRMFGISMAGYNAAASAVFAVASFLAARVTYRRARAAQA